MNTTGYAAPLDIKQDVCKASDTELARSSIEGCQHALADALDELASRLVPVLRVEEKQCSDGCAPPPPSITPMHGWLCGQHEQLRAHLDLVKSLNSRLEV